jgi:hypothetical protein
LKQLTTFFLLRLRAALPHLLRGLRRGGHWLPKVLSEALRLAPLRGCSLLLREARRLGHVRRLHLGYCVVLRLSGLATSVRLGRLGGRRSPLPHHLHGLPLKLLLLMARLYEWMAIRILPSKLLLHLLGLLLLTTERLLLEGRLTESDLPVLVWHLVVAKEVHSHFALVDLLTYNNARLCIHHHVIGNRLRNKSLSKILDLNFIFVVN